MVDNAALAKARISERLNAHASKQSSMSPDPDFGIGLEPKQVFLNMILIPTINQAMKAIYSPSSTPLAAVRPLRGVIACLSDKSKKRLEKQQKRLVEIEQETSNTTRLEIESIFDDIMTYLHETYLKEFDTGITDYHFKELEEGEQQ